MRCHVRETFYGFFLVTSQTLFGFGCSIVFELPSENFDQFFGLVFFVTRFLLRGYSVPQLVLWSAGGSLESLLPS